MAVRGNRNGSSERKQENAILKTNKVGDQQHEDIDDIDDSRNNEKIISRQIDKLDENDDVRINITISGKAYEALEKFTKELNQRESCNHKPFTIEEVLDEEVILLFTGTRNSFFNKSS
jgi:TPP-dependent indolepyruvate ferredoxin oxidoreductase alpha subunit